MTETEIMRATLVAVSALPGSLFYRNNTGVTQMRSGDWLRYGLVGSGDIMGCLRGRAVAIEVKTLTGRASVAQRRFAAAWERAGGVYIIARSPEQALAALAEINP